VQLATREPLPAPVTSERWQAASISVSGTEVVPSALIEKGGWVLNDLDQWRNNHTKRRTRLGRFTEQTSFWLAGSNGLAKSIVTSRDGMLHAVCTQAISIVSFGPTGAYEQERAIDLSRHLRYTVTMGGELEVRRCVTSPSLRPTLTSRSSRWSHTRRYSHTLSSCLRYSTRTSSCCTFRPSSFYCTLTSIPEVLAPSAWILREHLTAPSPCTIRRRTSAKASSACSSRLLASTLALLRPPLAVH